VPDVRFRRIPPATLVAGSLIGALAGGIAFALCRRFARNPIRVFAGLCVTVVLLYAAGPCIAAREPCMEGAELFNAATVAATQVMHLVSAAAVWFAMTRLATASSAPHPAPPHPAPT
jgi:hypothetical protein